MSASCCGSARKTAALVVLAVALGVLVPAVVVLGVKATREPPPAPPQIEAVDVVVATAELRVGTVFRSGNVEQLTAVKAMPVASLPEGTTLVASRAELVDKRLTRAAHRGEWLVPSDLKTEPRVFFGGDDIMSLPVPTKAAVAEGVRPGSRVDFIASYSEWTERHVFTLVTDVHALAIDGVQELPLRIDLTQDRSMLSFPVNQKQALLVALAHQLNCDFTVVLHRPGDQQSARDYDATLARLKELKRRQDAEPEVAPFPRAVP
ncbi:hypothetical protein [Gemmata sp.]|uniref:hypothetical protein n=1 Tax=Gemmata sp. TaxID=1914242 RepID=UPI003F6E5D2D